MQFLRIILLLVIVTLACVMAEFPSVYDTRRMAFASHSYNESKSDAALQQLHLAQQENGRDILFIESGFAVVFVCSIVLFIRIGRNLKHA